MNSLSRRAQAAALGRPDFDAVHVDHPIQDQTPAEIEARADRAFDEIVARLMTRWSLYALPRYLC